MKRKEKKQQPFKKVIFLLGISLLLWNCNKEEIGYLENSEAKIRHISYSDFKAKDNFSLLINKVEHKYFDRLKEVEKNEFLGKTIYSSDNTFYIQTDLIYETIKDAITNYTFKIERPQIDSLKIENLIVSLNNNTNQIKLYLLEMNESNIQNDIKFYPLDINTIDSDALFSNKTATILGVSVYVPDCTQVSYSTCGNNGNADGHAATGGKCVGSPTILDFSGCGTRYDDNTSSYSGGGIGTPIPTDNSSTSGGGTGSSSNTSNNNELIEGAVGIIRYDATAASALKNNLLLTPDQIAWIGDSENNTEVTLIYNFLEANEDSNGEYTIESENFATEATEAYRTNDFSQLLALNIFNQDLYDIWNNLSQREKDLIKSFPMKAWNIFKNREIAENATRNKFGKNGLNDKSDAFRHAYYNAINTKKVGAYMAQLFSDAHESEVPSRFQLEKTMDLFNNSIGHDSEINYPISSITELVEKIYKELTDGNLRYLNPIDYNDPNFNYTHGITQNTILTPTNN